MIIYFKSQLENILSAEAANSSVSKHYKEELAELMDCLDLTYHHHIKNLVTVYSNCKDNLRTGLERQISSLTQVCSSLDAKKDKEIFLHDHENLFLEPPPFKYEFHREFQAATEVRHQNVLLGGDFVFFLSGNGSNEENNRWSRRELEEKIRGAPTAN